MIRSILFQAAAVAVIVGLFSAALFWLWLGSNRWELPFLVAAGSFGFMLVVATLDALWVGRRRRRSR